MIGSIHLLHFHFMQFNFGSSIQFSGYSQIIVTNWRLRNWKLCRYIYILMYVLWRTLRICSTIYYLYKSRTYKNIQFLRTVWFGINSEPFDCFKILAQKFIISWKRKPVWQRIIAVQIIFAVDVGSMQALLGENNSAIYERPLVLCNELHV